MLERLRSIITEHDQSVGEGLHQDLTKEISGDVTSQQLVFILKKKRLEETIS